MSYVSKYTGQEIDNKLDQVSNKLNTSDLFNKVYPVGSIYMSYNSTSPASLFGGTWTQIKDRFLLSAGNTYSNGNTGGETNVTLTKSNIPNYKIGFIPTAVPGYHGEWANEGIKPGDMARGSRQDTVSDTSSVVDTQYGWDIYTNGGGTAHNNMPPYLVVNMWKRTA